MSINRQFLTSILLLVFGCLYLKSLTPSFSESSMGDCQELGHIHIYKIFDGKSAQTTADDLDDCHDGKSLSAVTFVPLIPFDFVIAQYKGSYDFVFDLENSFKSPFLEPLRKPPKNS